MYIKNVNDVEAQS